MHIEKLLEKNMIFCRFLSAIIKFFFTTFLTQTVPALRLGLNDEIKPLDY